MKWWPWIPKQVETVTTDATPAPSEPPEWFKKIYGDYLQSDEGKRLYRKPCPHGITTGHMIYWDEFKQRELQAIADRLKAEEGAIAWMGA